MKAKVYIETTIPSYLVARPSRDLLVAAHQQITRQWWETRRRDFQIYISDLVINEARSGDTALAKQRLEFLAGVEVLTIRPDILQMAGRLVSAGPIPLAVADDATHIATASAYNCEYLLTWNCRHIANAELRPALKRIVEEFGFELPNLCTPEELMGEQG
ncbi:MAG: type II toxin-antitoxin system VapC family toxin [Terriglobales bacterium]|jgi:predicted nucleic acid-binding protein